MAQEKHKCSFCVRMFLNRKSLATHTRKFHKKYNPSGRDLPTKEVKEGLMSHPAFGNSIPDFEEDSTKTRKRFRSNKDLSEQS